ncbi:uncharacterized protein MELLADRAFT_110140 [Melampsora larici-populina 98AG31]|uniref:Uncharacterized protein n=1 Tax=Melampsora larici-populina (strain 98AG31 / pathotype 3-4-7) TaxID=747676 RepID=F4RYT1_MELLP|nr:uncharacterized protein MELLADRAFT_110140 [Melampsora larici-populina 98AG31]EGG02300.1 hypothetical protein MELLADRAFT_110140 [Melampsora larici-populina 98AG31]
MNSDNKGKNKRPADNEPDSEKSSDDKGSDDNDPIEDATILKSTTVLPQTTLEVSTMAYPPPGSLTLFTVNPLLNSAPFEFASTSDLPYELQLWWQLYHHRHVTVKDTDLWAMVTLISQQTKSNLYELVKKVLNHSINYVELIIGPGASKFFLIRFKGTRAKELLQKDNRHDRGVFVSFLGSHKPTSLLIFDLEPIAPTTPTMSSLLVTMHGLPFPLHTHQICDTVWGSIAAVTKNHPLKLTGVRELSKKPIFAHGGGRVFEIHFEQAMAVKWLKLLSRPNKYIDMFGWDSKGAETDERYNLQIRFIPTCSQCGTSSYDGAHLLACPFVKIRDLISKALGRDLGPRQKPLLFDDTETTTPVASTSTSTSTNKPVRKIGNFTVRD